MDMDVKWMQMAIDEALKSPDDVPKVGAVIVKDNKLIGTGHRTDANGAVHAEHNALEDAISKGHNPKDSTVYTTLEPCSSLSGGRKSCSQRLIDSKVKTVFIGTYDRNPNIYRKGWRALKDSKIRLRDFTPAARKNSDQLNKTFNELFRSGAGLTGGAKFDYSQNGGRFEIFFDESETRSRVTAWTSRGADSIYAYDGNKGNLALAKYADSFSDIDDPDALDYESHSVPVGIKDIVVFRNDYAHVLVQVLAVEAGPERGFKNTSLKIRWQVRLKEM